ncbi:4-(cytidine 5'-diphospho)-2-C-methyl-D-erythritol kinase [Oceanibaculum indicum]|uniref:4-diphosphocytidyl-2-C-methyl-D-erythritol kinase n=1 Tax=Oceanibaculum indicum TaxID=526216 RepID=A0A420WC42_9PROT|nr:4-(cytidine 5'-diphospho)-2-C-methyl-D-erythritol kinase [Oceanibaculum indicum]RKQ68599.1 4-diphosphocytidyl-2-C-methyl-D-erythritol kinase [Oceanibaculum indicum]
MTAAAVSADAPAKLNLFLHVAGRRPDGYHLLDSLVAFTETGDRIIAEPANSLRLSVTGPFAGALRGEADNLVLRAARLLGEEADRRPDVALTLEKNLPVAAGIGGGSADAAATLRALIRLWGLEMPADRLAELGLRLGADVPACLLGRPCRLKGIGEQLDPLPALPALPVLLVNPGVPLSTPDVFRARTGDFGAAAPVILPEDPAALLDVLRAQRNDLTEAARTLVPQIGRVLDRLQALPGCLLARLSGSGPTCFALMRDAASVKAGADLLQAAEPGRWVCATRLRQA